MSEGNLPTKVLLQLSTKHTVVANENTAIQSLVIGADGTIAANGLAAKGIAEADLPVPLPATGTIVQVPLALEGLCQGISAGAITEGARLTVASGKLAVATTGQFVFGRAYSAATGADQKVLIYITREGVV
jgi:hypothetical protein